MRIRPSISQDTANDTASAANGSHLVMLNSTPPSGALISDGDVQAGLVLAQRGRQLVGRDDGPHRGDLGRREHPGADAGQQRDHHQVRRR